MPSTQRSTTPVGIDLEVMEGRYAELGDYTVAFETYKQDLDAGPYFRGLPEDRCICVHLGYLTSGQITFRYADHEETFVAGDAYVAPARHLPVIAYSRSNEPFPVPASRVRSHVAGRTPANLTCSTIRRRGPCHRGGPGRSGAACGRPRCRADRVLGAR
jgi:hypothetical protein